MHVTVETGGAACGKHVCDDGALAWPEFGFEPLRSSPLCRRRHWRKNGPVQAWERCAAGLPAFSVHWAYGATPNQGCATEPTSLGAVSRFPSFARANIAPFAAATAGPTAMTASADRTRPPKIAMALAVRSRSSDSGSSEVRSRLLRQRYELNCQLDACNIVPRG